jgi:hypothetical protein
MISKVKSFSGILSIERGHSYLVTSSAGRRPIPLFLIVPTGAAVLEGWTAATDYFRRVAKKGSGDRILIHGAKSRLGGCPAIQFSPDWASSPAGVLSSKPQLGDRSVISSTSEQVANK